MTQTLIEKLEALQVWDAYKLIDEVDQEAVKLSDLRTIIEQHKAECEPVGYVDESGLFTKDPYEYPNKSFTPVFLNRQTTPDQSARIAQLETQRDRLLDALNAYDYATAEIMELIAEIEASK